MRVARRVAGILALTAIYVVFARLGLMLDAVAGFATLVWAPTGISLAALLVFGNRLWPGVALGALITNLWTGAPLLVALGIATGNTLEAVIGAHALRQVPGFRYSIDRVRDALALIGLAAVLSSAISATIGVSSLYLGGLVLPAEFWTTWRAWWMGDLIGALVVAPLILVWTTRPLPATSRRFVEAAALSVAVVGLGVLVFGAVATGEPNAVAEAYLIFPAVIWAALRFGQRGAVTATFVTAVIAVVGTVLGRGPFLGAGLYESLLALQTFIGVAATTFLLLGAAVAERRQAEEQLRHAHQAATDANHAKGEFLAVMSHELRTPLNAIAGYADLLSVGVEGPVNDRQREYLARIQRSQQHLLTLIEDVLTFARSEAGHLSFDVEAVRVDAMLDSVESMVDPELRRAKLTLGRDGGDPRLTVRADEEKLRRILLNLLGNAIKFTPPGGRITIGSGRDQDTVCIWIRDTGIGIQPDQLSRVFEPFVQAERGTTRRYSGAGLGLAIARDLARAMLGDVRLESRVGEGTTASVVLPPG